MSLGRASARPLPSSSARMSGFYPKPAFAPGPLSTRNGHSRKVGYRPVADFESGRQHERMNANEYLLPKAADEVDLSPWASVLPADARIIRTSLFGDVYLVDGLGAVHAGARRLLDQQDCSVRGVFLARAREGR